MFAPWTNQLSWLMDAAFQSEFLSQCAPWQDKKFNPHATFLPSVLIPSLAVTDHQLCVVILVETGRAPSRLWTNRRFCTLKTLISGSKSGFALVNERSKRRNIKTEHTDYKKETKRFYRQKTVAVDQTDTNMMCYLKRALSFEHI